MERVLKEQSSRDVANAGHVAQGKTAQFPAQTDIVSRIDNSSLMIAQRKQLQEIFGDTAQLQVEEEEPLQGKFAAAQRVEEEEEPLQGVFATAQRVQEEDEPAQGKFDTVQRVEEEEPLQGKFASAATAQLEQQSTAKPNNTGLPDNLKTGIESLSGMSMDNVKVHYNSSQPAQLNALAYAQGSDIHVAPGQEQHLPHEAWHVIQQAQGRVQPTMQMKGGVPVNDDAELEHEADVMGRKAACGITQMVIQKLDEQAFSTPAPMQMQTATITVPDTVRGGNATTTTVIKATGELGEFDDPTVVANTKAIPVKPIDKPKGTPAYVANIISTARNKDKTLDQVAAQYAAEAFDTALDASTRFALAMLVNREEKPSIAVAAQTDDMKAGSTDQAAGITAFPAAAGRSFWRRKWFAGPSEDNLAEKTVAQIRTILDGASDPGVARTAADNAAKPEGLPSGVQNQARNKVRAIPQTNTWVDSFTTKQYSPFVHVADADAVTLKATENPDGSGEAKTLFSRYDSLIAGAQWGEVFSGGYRFAGRPGEEGEIPAHAAGAGGDGSALMAETEQAVKVSELDMKVRSAMHGKSRGMPYFPEPNLVVRGDLYKQQGVNFDGYGTEWLKLKSSLTRTGKILRGSQRFVELGGVAVAEDRCEFPVAARERMLRLFRAVDYKRGRFDRQTGQYAYDLSRIVVFRSKATVERALGDEWADEKRFVFDQKAALVTDVGRFDQPYQETSGVGEGKSGTNYIEGEKDPLALFDPARAHQSHAQWGAIKSAVKFTYRIAEGAQERWLENAMRTYLPQELFKELSETREDRGTLSERTTAATERLEQVQPQLQHFSAFTAAVSTEIQDPTQLLAKATELKGTAVALTRQHKSGAVAARLVARGVNSDFLDLLDDAAHLNIWDAATSGFNRDFLAQVTGALKAVGDAIAAFLQTYQ